MPLTARFLLIIFLEGYVVLTSELLAIRLLVPFVGSGIETVSIVIAAVLVPLAFGYYAGGIYLRRRRCTIRTRLVRNLTEAALLLTLALSYGLIEIYFRIFNALGLHHFWQTVCYVTLFLVYPLFLLGQTVPLLSNYFRKTRLSETTGLVLFLSTFGSFLGAILSTLVLMTFLGVHQTVSVMIGILVLSIALLTKKPWHNLVALVILAACMLLNHDQLVSQLGIIKTTPYSTIALHEWREGTADSRELLINRSRSAKISSDPDKRYEYVKMIERRFLKPLQKASHCPCKVLVIGAGGFTMGLEDTVNNYTYVDIDGALKEIAEQRLLRRKLGSNKQFVAVDARTFLRQNTEQYDLIILDAYTNYITIPSHLITREFFAAVKARLQPQGIVVFNAIVSPNFANQYSVTLDNTFRQVFPYYNREVIWLPGAQASALTNVIYSYYQRPYQDGMVYTDEKNRYFLDK